MMRYTYNRQVEPPAPFIHVSMKCLETFVLLGRDVLNRHRLLLDGPGLALEID